MLPGGSAVWLAVFGAAVGVCAGWLSAGAVAGVGADGDTGASVCCGASVEAGAWAAGGVAVEEGAAAAGWLLAAGAGVACCALPLIAVSASSNADAPQIARKANGATGVAEEGARERDLGRIIGAYERHFNRSLDSAAVTIVPLVITHEGHNKFSV